MAQQQNDGRYPAKVAKDSNRQVWKHTNHQYAHIKTPASLHIKGMHLKTKEAVLPAHRHSRVYDGCQK